MPGPGHGLILVWVGVREPIDRRFPRLRTRWRWREDHPVPPIRAHVFAVLLVAVTITAILGAAPGCGGKGGKPSGPDARIGAYPALRWVPADATYAIAARRTADVVAVFRELVDIAGIGFDADAAAAQAHMRNTIGIDLLSAEGLAELGADPAGGAAIFSTGLSPTIAIALADPARAQASIDRLRGGAVAVETTRSEGVEVFTYRGDPDLTLHWAIADGWLWLHLELVVEGEAAGTWFTRLRAAKGGLAGHADWAAAIAAGTALPVAPSPDGPPVVGLFRMNALADAAKGGDAACLAPLRRTGRGFLAAGVAGVDAALRFDLELGPAAADLASLALAPLAGWTAAREGAPIQLEWTLDLARAAGALSACEASLSQIQQAGGVRGFRLFAHAIDLGELDGKGAVHVDLSTRRVVAEALDEIPGRRFLEKKKRVGPYDGAEIAVPMFPAVTYVLSDSLFIAGVGIDLGAVIGAGIGSPSPSLAHLALVPSGLSTETWEGLLEPLGGSTDMRRRTVARIQRWADARVDLAVEGGALRLTAQGRHTR
jgi:hypothetical protein